MDDVLAVREREAPAHLVRDADCVGQRHAVIGGLLDQPLDITPTHELGDDKGLAVRPRPDQRPRPVGVGAEPAHRLRLARDALRRPTSSRPRS